MRPQISSSWWSVPTTVISVTLPRRFRALLVLGVAVLALSACGEDGDAPTTRDDSDESDAAADGAVAEDAEPDMETTEGVAEGEEEAEVDEAIESDSEPVIYDFSAVSTVVQTFVDERGLNGAGLIVVDRDDGVVYHDHWGGYDEDRISLIASSSKMIVAGVLLRLDDDGLLDIDAPVAEIVEWGSGNPDITPAQLISNSSGLVGLGPDPTFPPYLCQFVYVGTLQDCAETIFTTPDDDDQVIPPDSQFRYGGAQWQVAGAIAEAASGKSWPQLMDEIYVTPCELDVLAFNNHLVQIGGADAFSYPAGFDSDPSVLAETENPNMGAGAYVTTGDYGQLLLMHLRDGMCGENQVLSTDALARLHGDRILDAYDGSAGDETGYGMGWWVDRESGLIRDPGAYGTVAWLDLDDGYGAYMVIEADSATGGELADQLYDLIETAVVG